MSDVDWSGVAQRSRQVLPLNAATFVQRLQLLSARARDIRLLRAAMAAAKR